ncbi:MAG: UDP-N-acetylmuramate dehydrogenase [Ruminococcus sp.]|nr:UDP-N-acetylmuramate dehydrogenase [Ruminococcus sp.]
MKKWDELQKLYETLGCRAQMAEPLRNHTTFRIGGSCAAFVHINCVEALRQVLQYCRVQEIPYTVMGNGSNILAADEGYSGVVLHLGRDFSAVTVDGTRLHCQAGATLSRIGKLALEESLTGMECLAGIPGTVGGALYMNAGAYGGEMANVTVSAHCMLPDGTVMELEKEQMALGYRSSVFRGNRWLIMDVTLQLQPGRYGVIQEEMDTLMARRRAKQPLELPSAGSTFQRPVGSYASFLIDQCGLKGASAGDAQVSTKHAGFVVNTGKATCHDVLELCDFVKQTVQEKTGYQLQLEPVILGDPK